MKCNKNVVSRVTSKALGLLGSSIGRHPTAFFLLPLTITLVFSTGMQNLRYVDDAEFLFSPRNGPSKRERSLVDSYFPMNQSGGFSASRLTSLCRVGRVLVVAGDGGTVLRRQVFDELLALDRLVREFQVSQDGHNFRYQHLCAHWHGTCVDNGILALGGYMDKIESGEKKLQYPAVFDTDSFKLIVLPAHLGGMRRDQNGTVTEAMAVSLGYFVASESPSEDERGRLWEERFLEVVKNVTFHHINVSYFTSETLQNELDQNLREGTPYVTISLFLMFIFSATSCMSTDCVRSKAWLGMMGVVCTSLGILSSFGFLIYCGVEFTGINFTVPFLALGIGLDDTFVMINSWRQTNPLAPVPIRLQQTLQKAGISITITSATDFLSFWIGVITPFEAIRIFCIYIATSILFVYLVHITMFAACMAWSGYSEKSNRHGLICIKVVPASKADERSSLYKFFCTGGREEEEEKITKLSSWTGKHCSIRGGLNTGAMSTAELTKNLEGTVDQQSENDEGNSLGDLFTKALNVFWIKIAVLLSFGCYLAVAIWGLQNLSEGLDVQNLCRYNSQAAYFYSLESQYFQQYRVQILVDGKHNYSDMDVQESLENMLTTFENKTYMAGRTLSESWLRSFKSYVRYTDLGFNNESEFVQEVKKFIQGSYYELDVKFSDDGESILASRFFAQTEDVSDSDQGTFMMTDLRAQAQDFPFNVTIFNAYFLYFDQFTMVRPYTSQCVAVAAVVMMAVAVIFLPDVACAVCIAMAILSIEVGVVGFMAIWGIKLDAIAMINLIMCIGFSVDFSAHIAHAFLSAPPSSSSSPHAQMRHAFSTAGIPIFQGAASTVLAILPLMLVPSYIAMAFFKIIFLVTILGGVHALFLLPVLLSFVTSNSRNLATCWRSSVDAPDPEAELRRQDAICGRHPKLCPKPATVAVIPVDPVPITIQITQIFSDLLDEDAGLGTSADDCSDSSLSTPRVEIKACKSMSSEMAKYQASNDKSTQTSAPSLGMAFIDRFRGGYDTDVDDDDDDDDVARNYPAQAKCRTEKSEID